jgi:hypothetical protein
MVDDGFVGFEDAVREPVVAHELPDVFLRVQLGAFGRERNDRDIGRDGEPAGEMPTGLIDEQRGMDAGRDLRGDFGEVQVHRLGVATRHDERRALPLLWADSAENVGRGSALVSGSARARATPGPAPGDLILLSDARLIGEPDLYGAGIDALFAPDLLQARGETFLKSSIAPAACA